MIKMGKFSPNKIGNDYIVGDIHGDYNNLIYQLDNLLKFDYKNDRLFCVGDLVDRGADNIKCLNLLNEKWFFSCIGNHELMILNLNQNNVYEYKQDWFLELKKDEKEYVCNLILNKMYSVIELFNKDYNIIGIVHAEYTGNNWYEFINNLHKIDLNYDSLINFNNYKILYDLLWGRSRFKENNESIVENVYKIIVGHTLVQSKEPNKNALQLGNYIYLDTGGVYKGIIESSIVNLKIKMNILKNNHNKLTRSQIFSIEDMQQRIFELEKRIANNIYNLSFYDVNSNKIIKGIL